MPKSFKQKKGEKSLKEKTRAKKKGAKQKLSDSSKGNAEKADIQNSVIEDEKWQCSIVLLVPQTLSLHNFLLQTLVNLPENITVLTQDSIADTKDKKSKKGSITRTSIRSTSKSSKQSNKKKTTKSKNEIKKGNLEKVELVESKNDEISSFKVCLALKKLLIGLRNTDMESFNKNITSDEVDISENKIKSKDFRNRGLEDGFDNKITKSEENYTSNLNVIHRFVILLGFYDPLLPEILNKLNVALKAIINVTDDNMDTHSNERPSTVTAKSKREPSRKSKKGSVIGKTNKEYCLFIEKTLASSNTAEFLENCRDTVFLNFSIENPSTKSKEIGLHYKSDMLRILYKIKDAWNKYKVYTKTLSVQDIPTNSEILNLDDAKIYSTLISMVPLECTSIAVILHCILEQIVWCNDDNRSREETDNQLISENILHKSSTSATKSSSKNTTPTLIHHRDKIKYNTFHLDLPEFDFERIITNMFMKSPIFKLWDRYPSHSEPAQKWFQFQLQKLYNSSVDCILKLDSLFPKYLHFLLMDILVYKTYKFTNLSDHILSTEPKMKTVHQILLSEREPEVCDNNSDLFIKEIIYNILCKVTDFSLCQNYGEIFEFVPSFPIEISECSLKQPAYTNRLRNKSFLELPGETLLEKRALHKQEKLDKLVSFLNCSEFVSLYEDFLQFNFCATNRLAKYGFIEVLDTQTLCQCLQQASEAFSNINYDYFPVTDSILLWFNNSNQDQVLSSYSSKSVLETPLGFRDFYCHKLRESTDCGDLIKEEIIRKGFEESGNMFEGKSKVDLESQSDNHSKVEVGGKQCSIKAPNATTVYNLGSLWLEFTESYDNYFSVDSSSVVVKRETYFDNKTLIVVDVRKNNTSLRYNLDPENSNDLVQLLIDVHEILNLKCVLNWEIDLGKPTIWRNSTKLPDNFETCEDSKFKLICSLSITLPSGLFVEVVPTSSVLGPFYVRQRYLAKGPNCNSIWEENYRCYFKNGMVLIFRVDGSVDIVYNNGTTVKCSSFELTIPDKLLDTIKNNKMNQNIKEAASVDLNPEETHRTKESSNRLIKKKGKATVDSKKSHSGDVNEKETNKQSQKKKKKNKKEPKVSIENKEEISSQVKEMKDVKPFFKVVEHSVLSWDGEFTQFNAGVCTEKKKCLNLRSAFDIINHELYWQRSDGMSGLQAPGTLTIKFPDGNKTSSFTLDNKELWVENDYGVIYRNTGDLVKVESFKVAHSTSSMDVELKGGKGDKSSLLANVSSLDSFGTESLEEKGFVYIENNFLMEHTNYASVEFSNEEFELRLTLPGNCWIIVDESGQFSFKGDKNERINLFNNSLLFEANVLNKANLSKSSTTFRFENVGTSPNIFSQTVDSFGNVFSVDERGNTIYSPCVSCENYDQSSSSPYCVRFPQNIERFFVFNRDLTGYEMIHEIEHVNTLPNQDVNTVNTPVVKGDTELFSLYMQSPIYRTKGEDYLMQDVEEIAPSLIKRKDLLKTHQTPEKIWFYPEISSVKKLTEKKVINAVQPEKKLKAMMIAQRMKMKKKGLINVVSFFSKSLTKYMEINEQIYQKYLNYLSKETLKEEDLIECENNRMSFLGSKSYYLTDNLPLVITEEMTQNNEPNKDIYSIFSPAISKVSF